MEKWVLDLGPDKHLSTKRNVDQRSKYLFLKTLYGKLTI